MTIKLTQAGFAKGVVESAVVPTSAGVDAYVPWSMVIHNIGDTGIFGGGIVNASGPGNVVVKWYNPSTGKYEEIIMPPDPTTFTIFHYVDAQPNCTRLNTSGQIKFMVEGTYIIQIHGVHQEGTAWYSDDYREFTVVASGVPPEEYCSLSGVVTGLFGMSVANATVELNGEKRTTDASGAYAFIQIPLGSYKLKVSAEPWYEPFEKDLSLTEVNKSYTQDVGLSLKSYIKYGVPLAAVAGIGGFVYIKRAKAPAYAVPTGYELVPRAPPGYRMVRE